MAGLKTHDVEHAVYHDHNEEEWFGKSADQSGNNWATELSLTAFQGTSGDGALGTAIKVLGSADTPVRTGKRFFDLHRLFITASSATTLYYVRLIWGTGSDANVEEAAGRYTDFAYMKESAAGRGSPADVRMPPLKKGTKVWAKVKNTTNLATLDFFFGLHEYN